MRWVGVRKGERIFEETLKKTKQNTRGRQSNRKEQWHENIK